MYICESCGEVFASPRINIITPESFYSYDPPEAESLCPFCDSDYFHEASFCRYCGEWVSEIDPDFEMCPDCEKKAKDEILEKLDGASKAAKDLFDILKETC